MPNQPREPLAPEDQTPAPSPLLNAIILGIAGCVALMGLANMIGWHTRTLWLVKWTPTSVAMIYNTSLSFLLLASGLVLAKLGHRRWQVLMGITVTVLSLATLMQYVLGMDFGIDQLFAKHFFATKAIYPGRMAAKTAVCFMFGGLALAVGAQTRASGQLWMGLGGAVLVGFGLTSFFGYLVEVESAYSWSNFGKWNRMAIQTSFTFLGLGVGLIALAWEKGEKQVRSSANWWPLQLFVLFGVTIFETWMAIQTAQTNQETRDSVYQVIVVWFPFFGIMVSSLISLLLYHITERQQGELALKESEGRFRQIFEQNPTVSMLIDPATGAILDANRTAERYYGYPRSTLLAMTITEINTLPPDRVALEMANAVQEKRQYFLFHHKLATGELRDVEVYSGPVTIGGRKILYSFIHDITERKRVDEALKEIQRLLAETERIGKVGGWEFNIDTGKQTWTEEIFNIHEVDLFYDPTMEKGVSFYTPASRPIIERAVQRAIEYNEPFDVELEIITAKGNLRSVHVIGKGDLTNRIIYGFFQDITERKRMENELKKSRHLLEETEMIAKVGGWECDIDTKKTTWTEEVYRIHEADLAYEPNFEKGINFYAPDSRPVIAEAAQRAIEHGEPFDLELEILTAKGNLRSVHTIGKRDLGNRRIHGFFQDITERKRIEALLLSQQEELRYFYELPFIGMAITDPETKRWVTVNDQLCQMLGYSREEIIKLTWVEMTHPDDLQSDLDQVAQVLRGEIDGYVLDKRFIRKDGRVVFTILDVRCLRRSDGRVDRFVATLMDISERKQYESVLLNAREHAEQAVVAKADFLATMSHEIRTPINVVLGMTEVLLETDLNPDQLRFVRTMHHSGNALLTVINDVLDFSRIEAGRFTLNEVAFSPSQLVEETVSLMQIAAEEKGLTMMAQVALAIPEAILGDDARVRQVLINLLGNAIKFTHQGQIEVVLSVHPQKPATLQFYVIDTGIGISPEQLGRVFERFTQADSGITRQYGGSGLGLTISQRLVAMMGGELGVESLVGQGSTFSFTLPARIVDTSKMVIASESITTDADICSLRILLVEDSQDNQALFQTYLKKSPHRLVMVNDGLEAVARVREETFDLVLMDIQMPNMDGLSATQAIRQWEREEGHPPLTILALSAHALAEEKEKSLAAGCNDHLTKPIKKLDLLKAIQQVGNAIDKQKQTAAAGGK